MRMNHECAEKIHYFQESRYCYFPLNDRLPWYHGWKFQMFFNHVAHWKSSFFRRPRRIPAYMCIISGYLWSASIGQFDAPPFCTVYYVYLQRQTLVDALAAYLKSKQLQLQRTVTAPPQWQTNPLLTCSESIAEPLSAWLFGMVMWSIASLWLYRRSDGPAEAKI